MQCKYEKLKLTRAQDRRAKATDEQVREMRELYENGMTQREIAQKYGLGRSTVCYIVSDRARENLAKYMKIHPRRRRTKKEAAEYMRELRSYKKSLYQDAVGGTNTEFCVSCGEEIPEGRLVCPKCEVAP